MKLSSCSILITTLIALLLGGCADEGTRLRNMPKDALGVPMLKNIYARDFLIGTAIDFRSPTEYTPREVEIIKSQFNVITPENSMKPINTHPAENRWNWAAADSLVNFCHENNIQVVGHTLVWHAQTPNWFFHGDNDAPVSREQALARLKEHIEGVVGHFKGKVKGWDVVNEVIDDSAHGETENLRNSQWLRAIGPDYITWAFKFAHDADPQAELYYNDYNIERGAKHQSSLLLLKRLIRDGAPITAVGIQGHWSLTYLPYKDIDKAIRDYKALGLKVNITELDITITGQGGGQFGQTAAAAGAGIAPGFGRGRGPAGSTQTGATLPAPTTVPDTTSQTVPIEEDASATEPAAATAPSTATGPTSITGPAATGPSRFGRSRGFGFGRPQSPPTPQQLQAQAIAYAKLFQIFQQHKDVITRVTFWGINDRRSWRAGQSPLLFDNNNIAKPAIREVALAKQWEW